MITKLTLQNFKSVGTQVYEFTQFDLIVGFNNSGKTTILQSLAVWQFCVEEFRNLKRDGNSGTEVVLPNFTVMSVPVFNLLWKDQTTKASQKPILISIEIEWLNKNGRSQNFGISLRYTSSQVIYAIPIGGWKLYKEHLEDNNFPQIVYVPPFSGLDPREELSDKGPIRQKTGKSQPGSILRNLLLRASGNENGKSPSQDWHELVKKIEQWFGVTLSEPQYKSGDVNIIINYIQNKKSYDIIAAGSGFHQILILLAFLYGYKPTTILLDEPDAHLHTHLQRQILDYFKLKSAELGTQFIIASHAEEFVRGVDARQIISLMSGKPERIDSTPELIRAMADIANEDIARLRNSPFILYVEGESDERILRAWAEQCGATSALDQFCFHTMKGGTKKTMKDKADEHFDALKQIIPKIKKMMLFDYDDEDSFHPPSDNFGLSEWNRKNIENYLLVPEAWKRAALKSLGCEEGDLFSYDFPIIIDLMSTIDQFFSDQNMILPTGRMWRNVNADIFNVVNGKRILFQNDDALFHSLRRTNPRVNLNKETIALNMRADEIHEDVHQFFKKLDSVVKAVAI